MPFVPSPDEARRLRRAVDRASLSEGERVFWLFSFALVLGAGAILATLGAKAGMPHLLTTGGLVGFVFGAFVLYWRVRGVFAARSAPEAERGLHSLSLRTREQRAFTALMLRQALTGRNPLGRRGDHDPLESWHQRNREVGIRGDA